MKNIIGMKNIFIAALILSNFIALDDLLIAKQQVKDAEYDADTAKKVTHICLGLDSEIDLPQVYIWNSYFLKKDNVNENYDGIIMPTALRVEKIGAITLRGDGIMIAGFGFNMKKPYYAFEYADIAADAYYKEIKKRIRKSRELFKKENGIRIGDLIFQGKSHGRALTVQEESHDR